MPPTCKGRRGQTVLEAGDAAASGGEIGRRFGARRRPFGDRQGQQHKNQKHADRRPVRRLGRGRTFDRSGGQSRPGEEQPSAEAAEKASGAAHHLLSSRPWVFSSSNVELALAT